MRSFPFSEQQALTFTAGIHKTIFATFDFNAYQNSLSSVRKKIDRALIIASESASVTERQEAALYRDISTVERQESTFFRDVTARKHWEYEREQWRRSHQDARELTQLVRRKFSFCELMDNI